MIDSINEEHLYSVMVYAGTVGKELMGSVDDSAKEQAAAAADNSAGGQQQQQKQRQKFLVQRQQP